MLKELVTEAKTDRVLLLVVSILAILLVEILSEGMLSSLLPQMQSPRDGLIVVGW